MPWARCFLTATKKYRFRHDSAWPAMSPLFIFRAGMIFCNPDEEFGLYFVTCRFKRMPLLGFRTMFAGMAKWQTQET